jgi:hypothetical protein
MEPLGWLLVGLAAAIDIGLLGGSSKRARHYRRSRHEL